MIRVIRRYFIQDFRSPTGWLRGWIAILNQDFYGRLANPEAVSDRREIKDTIHSLRMQATLAEQCYSRGSQNINDKIEAQVLFAQADALERRLMRADLAQA